MHVHAYVPTLSHPAENLEDSVARAQPWRSVMNLYEALEGLRCPGARLCRCLNRNSGLLRSCGAAAIVRAGRHEEKVRRWRERWGKMQKGGI